MRQLLVIALFFLVSILAKAPITLGDHPDAIKGHYIVVLHENKTITDVESTITKYSIEATHKYKLLKRGFAAAIDDITLDRLANDPSVNYIETQYNQYITQACDEQTGATWGIARTSNLQPGGTTYTYSGNEVGSGVEAYVLDTSIFIQHPQFQGRAHFLVDFVGDGDADGNGHGTHVAGTIGSQEWGMAKDVSMLAVKVCSNLGSCPSSATTAAYELMVERKQANPNTPMIVNMSYGGTGGSGACSDIARAANEGVVFVAASGNSNANACNFYPASCDAVISVGSTTSTDARSSFSNYGNCLDLFAPGSSIVSCSNTGTGSRTLSGTSMASPHVCGMGARFLSNGVPHDEIRKTLTDNALPNVVTNPGSGSPNLLLHRTCVS